MNALEITFRVIGSILVILLIVFVALYIAWREHDLIIPVISALLVPAFRCINKLLFKILFR